MGDAEDADVLWLQAGEWYADLRIPYVDDGGPVEAFAGPARWRRPIFTWEHHLDWLGTFPSDEGTIEADGADLIERGTFVADGRAVPYVERWERVAGPDDLLVARVASPTGGWGVLVEIAPHRLVLVDDRAQGGGFAVRRDDHRHGRWVTTFARGGDLGSVVAGTASWSSARGDAITSDGWTLTVVDVAARDDRSVRPT